MFTLVAAIVFFAAALIALGTVGSMFMLYREKMLAALLFQPMPETAPVYAFRVRRARVAPRTVSEPSAIPAGMLAV